MPLGDGTYYRAGGYYTLGSVYVDAADRPVYTVGLPRSSAEIKREALALQEWQQAYQQGGEDALTALEARRQQTRLERKGVAHAFRPTDVCAGGKRLTACDPAVAMTEAASAYVGNAIAKGEAGSGRRWDILTWLSRTCATCSLHCEVAVQSHDGTPTGITRFTNTNPSGVSSISTVRISLDGVRGSDSP
jgi:hypothetical protein